MFSYGLVKPAIATSFGFFANEQAVIWAVIGLISAGAVYFVPKLMKLLEEGTGLLLLNSLLGFGYLGAALPIGWLGFFILLLINVVGNVAYPWISIVVNREVESKYRATTLSTIALVSKIPYVFTAIIAGFMIDKGYLWTFNLVIGLLMLVISSFVIFRRVLNRTY